LPRTLHPQALPATDSRVASRLASFSASGREAQVAPLFNSPVAPADASPGPARLLHLPALPAMDLRVAPNLASFSTSGAVALGLPCSYAPPVAPVDTSPGLPRLPYLPALPATDFRVAPRLTSFGASGADASGLPLAPLFQLRLPVWLRVAPHSHTFRLCLGFESPGCPASSLPRHRLMVHRVSSVSAPSGFAVPASSGCPESCIYGWVDDDFPVLLELCILGWSADESSWSIG